MIPVLKWTLFLKVSPKTSKKFVFPPHSNYNQSLLGITICFPIISLKLFPCWCCEINPRECQDWKLSSPAVRHIPSKEAPTVHGSAAWHFETRSCHSRYLALLIILQKDKSKVFLALSKESLMRAEICIDWHKNDLFQTHYKVHVLTTLWNAFEYH